MMPVFASWADGFVAVELGDSRGKEKQCTGGKSCSAKSPLSGFEIHNNDKDFSHRKRKKTKKSKQNLFFWLDMTFLRIKVTCAVWLMRNAMKQMTYFRAPKMCCVPWYSSDSPRQQRTTTCFGIQLASSWQIQSLWAHSSDIAWRSRGFLLTFQILKRDWL